MLVFMSHISISNIKSENEFILKAQWSEKCFDTFLFDIYMFFF